MTQIRSLVFALWLYGSMAVVGGLYAPGAIYSQRIAMSALRVWGRVTLWGLRWIVGLKVVFEGREHIPPGAVLVAAKHQAMIDTLLPALMFSSPAIVLKRELQSEPIYGWYTKQAHMIPVDREAHAAALKAMLRAAKAAAEQGRQVFIFPEGTRQELDAPPDYKPGVAALYQSLKLPCLPIALNTGLYWKPKGLPSEPGLITVKILPPIPPGLPREDFMRELETRIESESQALLPPHLRRTTPA